MNKNNLHIVHMNNDYTGSTRVISRCIEETLRIKQEVYLYSSQEEGILSDLPVAHRILIPYKFHHNKFLRLYRYFFWQILLFLRIYKNLKKNDLVLINTCLPFSASLAAKMKRCKCVYYLHENKVGSSILTKFLFYIIRYYADGIIYVSKYLMEYCKKYNLPNGKVLYNPTVFQKTNNVLNKKTKFNVLMLSSFKAYKGIYEFIKLAEQNDDIYFTLVISSNDREAKAFRDKHSTKKNINIFLKQKEVQSFYKSASVVINLSNPNECIETFGMTVIEGFSFGLPALVPKVGGIAEIVENEINGYHVDPNDLLSISSILKELKKNKDLYQKLAYSAHERFDDFSSYPIIDTLNELYKRKLSA